MIRELYKYKYNQELLEILCEKYDSLYYGIGTRELKSDQIVTHNYKNSVTENLAIKLAILDEKIKKLKSDIEKVELLLDYLEEREKRIIELKIFECLTWRQVSKRMGVPVVTCYKIMVRINKKIER